MLLAQHLVPGPGLWSLGLQALWSVALSAQSGEDRFGDRQIVLAHAGSIIRFTGIADIMPVDGIIIKLTRIEERWDNEASNDAARTGGCFFATGILSLTICSAWAFTRENVSPTDGGNYSFDDPNNRLTDPDNHNSGQSARPLGSNGPVVQFGIQQGPLTPFGRGNGYNSTPDPYFRPLNGN
jgi:hypothetical protein